VPLDTVSTATFALSAAFSTACRVLSRSTMGCPIALLRSGGDVAGAPIPPERPPSALGTQRSRSERKLGTRPGGLALTINKADGEHAVRIAQDAAWRMRMNANTSR
jgi:hypothetical protein